MTQQLIDVAFGAILALLSALFGVWLRSGWLARKLTAKKVKP